MMSPTAPASATPPEPPPTQQNPDAPSSPGRSDLGLSGPLEDGFRELMPFVAQADDGNVDPSIVERMERDVDALTENLKRLPVCPAASWPCF